MSLKYFSPSSPIVTLFITYAFVLSLRNPLAPLSKAVTSFMDDSIPKHIISCHELQCNLMQCPPVNRVTLGQHKNDYNNRMIQLTDVFCVLLRYRWASNF